MPSPRRVLTLLRPKHWPVTLRKVPSTRRVRLLLRLRFLSWWHNAPLDVHIDPDVTIGKRIYIELKPYARTSLSVGKGSTLGDGVRLRLRGGSITLGDTVDVRANCVLNVGGGTLTLDGQNNLGWGTVVHCAESVHLSRFCHAGEYVTIVDSSHFYTEPDEWSYLNDRTAPIDLGVDVWMCPKSVITSGVTIGDHTIVASDTVVVKDAPAGVLLSGVPAKVVRELDQPWRNVRSEI